MYAIYTYVDAYIHITHRNTSINPSIHPSIQKYIHTERGRTHTCKCVQRDVSMQSIPLHKKKK